MARGEDKGTDPETIGGGFISMQHRAPSVEVTRSDELSEAAVPHPRPWTKLPRNRKTKIALMGIGRSILDKADPRYKRALLLANSYRKVRSTELATMHGCISSGASALLASASLALAASRFLYEKVAETGDIGLLKLAASLGDTARQSELAAWEMSAREGLAKRKLESAQLGVPWLKQQDAGQAKSGRKTNAERQQRVIDAPLLPSKGAMTIEDVLASSLTTTGDEGNGKGKRLDSKGAGEGAEVQGSTGDCEGTGRSKLSTDGTDRPEPGLVSEERATAERAEGEGNDAGQAVGYHGESSANTRNWPTNVYSTSGSSDR